MCAVLIGPRASFAAEPGDSGRGEQAGDGAGVCLDECDELSAERERLAEEREQLRREAAALEELYGSVDDSGWFGQFSVLGKAGGYGVQRRDGAVDGGLSYGGRGESSFGYATSSIFAFEHHLQFDYSQGHALGLKSFPGQERQTIEMNSWRMLNEGRIWLGYLGLGGFADYRVQQLAFADQLQESPMLTGGPSLTLASGSVDRQDAYMMLTGRWAPLFDGHDDMFSAEFTLGIGYMVASVDYAMFTGEHLEEGTFRRGDELGVHLGFRVPFGF